MTATLAAGPQVNLTWRDNANNETGFNVQRSTDGVNYTVLATVPPRTNGNATVSYTDTTVVAGATTTTYSYRVTAINAFVQSAPTNVASVVMPILPAVPTSFTAANGPNGNGNNRTVNLTWVANTANVTGFTIQRSTSSTFANGITTTNVAATATTLSVTGLSRSTAYYFRIRANNGAIVSSLWLNATQFPITTNP